VGTAGVVGGPCYYFGMSMLDGDYQCLPLYGDVSAQRRLYDRQRLGLEARRSAVQRLANDDSARLDPVLRFHMGLDGKSESESR
jgi:hypothetical protein